MKTSGSQKVEVIHDFWLKTFRDSKVTAAKGHDKKFRSRPRLLAVSSIKIGSSVMYK